MIRQWIGWTVLLAGLYTALPCAAQEEITQVEAVAVETGPDAVQVLIQTNRAPVYRAFTLTNGTAPMKLALDFKDALMVTDTEHIQVDAGPVKQVRISQWYQAPPRVRVMIDFTAAATYTVEAVPDGIRVRIPVSAKQPVPPVAAAPQADTTTVVQKPAPTPVASSDQHPPGARAEASERQEAAPAPLPASSKQPARAVLNYVDAPLPTVLRVFAELYNLNIVLAKDVMDDPVTVKLNDVELEPALNAILTANGYSYYRQDNIIIVKDAESEQRGELVTEVFKLKYANAFDFIEQLQEIISDRGNVSTYQQEAMGEVGVLLPSVSSGGGGGATGQQQERVEVDTERSDVLIVQDVPESIERIRKIIKELDQPQKQVRIDAQLVETTLSEDTKMGINWTMQVEMVGRGGSPTSVGQQQQQDAEGGTIIPGIELGSGNLRFGTLSLSQLKAFLELLDQKGNSKVLNRPSITVLNNQQADIAVGTLVPIELEQPIITAGGGGAGVTQGGGTLIQQQFVSVALTVIPRINDDINVTMWVQPVISEITGFTGSNNDLPIVSARSANTQVRVRDSDTVVIGGLNKKDQVKTNRKIKFLGDLPLFGRLFRHETLSEKNSELLIFITPTIIHGETFGEATANIVQ